MSPKVEQILLRIWDAGGTMRYKGSGVGNRIRGRLTANGIIEGLYDEHVSGYMTLTNWGTLLAAELAAKRDWRMRPRPDEIPPGRLPMWVRPTFNDPVYK